MNNRCLYFFNPDHDLALANGDENFAPPIMAYTFGVDVGCFPMWYAEPGSTVLANLTDKKWLFKMQELFPQLSTILVESQPDFSSIESLCPWGWNVAVRKLFLAQGIADQLLPDLNQLAEIRRLSHRKTAIEALQFLHSDSDLTAFLPPTSKQLSANEAELFAKKYQRTVFKAPWSGSGRGHNWISGSLSENAKGWCRNIAEKQGCVIGEQMYDKVRDFAMEFRCSDGKVSFAGYSLFETGETGGYKSNALMSDSAILKIITQLIPNDLLLNVQKRLMQFIENEIAVVYSGYLGVDMLIYKSDNGYLLHPCVEINLRMTMGMAARLFYDRFVHPNKIGHFYVDYYPSSEELSNDHNQREQAIPLQIENGRITHGYMSLSPVIKNSHYRIRVEIK
jgi:hypothetical protein